MPSTPRRSTAPPVLENETLEEYVRRGELLHAEAEAVGVSSAVYARRRAEPAPASLRSASRAAEYAMAAEARARAAARAQQRLRFGDRRQGELGRPFLTDDAMMLVHGEHQVCLRRAPLTSHR